jgi:hypothetical protein
MPRWTLIGLLLLCSFVTVPVYAGNGWTLYDNFNSGTINPDKWYGYEDGTTARETTRKVVSGKLNLFERSYGYPDSNDGATFVEQSLGFNNPESIRGIKAVVNFITGETVGCNTNSHRTLAWVRLFGKFFNTDPQGFNNRTNDVYAQITVERDSLSTDPDGTARIRATVRQCMDIICNKVNTLYANEDLGSINEGQSATCSMEWDKTHHKFIFKRDTHAVEYSYDTNKYPDTYPPAYHTKKLAVLSEVPNCTSTPRPSAFMNALFDNVYIKTFSP